MNRPFPAFGALLGLAALAMFAVSSTSRSTGVRPLPGSQTQTARQSRARGGNFIFIVPAPASDCCEDIDGESFENFEPAQEDRSVSTATFSTATFSTATFSTATSLPRIGCEALAVDAAEIHPVQVAAVESSAAPQAPAAAVDCLSHYDPVYDRAVYGEQADCPVLQADRGAPGSAAGLAQGRAEREADERIALFRHLMTLRPMTPAHRVPTRSSLQPAAPFFDETRLLARGVHLWVASQIRVLFEQGANLVAPPDCPAAPMDWNEYADLMDDAARPAAVASLSTANADGQPDVRSGDALLHSAASSLNRLGRLLQTAAFELEGAIAPQPSQRAGVSAP